MSSGLWFPKLSAEETAKVARRFFDSVESGDIATAAGLLHPSAKIWHNTDQITGGPDGTSKTLTGLHKILSNIKYRDIQLASWPGGFVEQHTFTATRKADGGEVRMPACVICDGNSDGKITRLDEYLDSAATNTVAGPPKQSKMKREC